MKKVLLAITVLFTTSYALAAQTALLCQEIPGQSQGALQLNLTKEGLDQNAPFSYIADASWSYAYSSANMTCSTITLENSGPEQFRCIGFVSNDINANAVEITLNLNNSQGTATVHNRGSDAYSKKTEGMVLPCRIVTQ
jgi:hypothetical protein